MCFAYILGMTSSKRVSVLGFDDQPALTDETARENHNFIIESERMRNCARSLW